MDNDLKKVGLVFKADGTTDFIKSLQNINDTLTENYSQFKMVQAQWDSSTQNSDKLKAKLEYLNNAYESQKDKVNLLTSELHELQNAEERNESAIQKKQNQLLKAETKLVNYKKQINETSIQLDTCTNHLIVYGKNLDKIGDNLEKSGKKLRSFSLIASAGLSLSAKSAIDFEDAFAGVKKTVDATEQEFEGLKQGILDMSTELPASTTEISAVAEAAGQLGIQTDNILSFTKTMIDLGESTNLSASEAADSLARFANITNMSQKDFDKLGSTIVELGNNCATTEAEIVNMGLRIAGAGTTIGMSESEIMSFAAALSSVGIEAEAGGSAMSKMMINIESAVSSGSNKLEKYAQVAGMTAAEFKKYWQEDATGAMVKFIEGLGNVEKNGGNLINTLSNLDISEVRLRDTMLRLANSSELFANTVILGTNAWEENNALSIEAAKRYETLKSKIDIAKNKLQTMAITLGTKLMPSISKILDGLSKWIDKFNNLDEKQVDLILKIGLLIAAASPLLTLFGKLTSAVGGTMTAIGTFSQALKVSQGLMTSTSTTVNGLASIFSFIQSPIGLACAGIVAAITTIKLIADSTSSEVTSKFDSMGKAASDFYNGIKTAESHLSEFNSTLFASNEEQQKLQQNMEEIQNGITTIAKRASDERRGYTDQEIAQLDDYFEKLRELKNQELEIQNQIANAISQQAIMIAETSKGNLEEYQVVAQEWIRTAEDQKNSQLAIINQRTTEEIALLNVRYGQKATLENEEYKREYDAIVANKEEAIRQANDQVSKVYAAFSNGYGQRILQNDNFLSKIKEANSKLETAQQEHAIKLDEIEDGNLHGQLTKQYAILKAEEEYKKEKQKIWEQLYKNMSDEQASQLGVWLVMLSDTELYGGKIDDETGRIVDGIITSYDSMPKKTKEAMKNAMAPLLDEMKNTEPSLFAKATGIAEGILSRLKKAFDIHSPSKKTRAIFKNVMKGSLLGLKDEEKNLYNQTSNIADNIQDKFENMNSKVNNHNFDENVAPSKDLSEPITSQCNIDYDKLFKAFLRALNACRLTIDKEGFIKFVENVVYEVM